MTDSNIQLLSAIQGEGDRCQKTRNKIIRIHFTLPGKHQTRVTMLLENCSQRIVYHFGNNWRCGHGPIARQGNIWNWVDLPVCWQIVLGQQMLARLLNQD